MGSNPGPGNKAPSSGKLKPALGLCLIGNILDNSEFLKNCNILAVLADTKIEKLQVF